MYDRAEGVRADDEGAEGKWERAGLYSGFPCNNWTSYVKRAARSTNQFMPSN